MWKKIDELLNFFIHVPHNTEALKSINEIIQNFSYFRDIKYFSRLHEDA